MKTKILILSFFLIIISFGCIKNNIVSKKSLIIGDPLECGISQTLLFPVGTRSNLDATKEDNNSDISWKRKGKLYFSENKSNVFNDRLAKVEYINENLDDFDIRNILFYNLITGKSHPLSTDTFHILSFAIHTEFIRPLIFYRIVKTDLNKDKKFDSSDPVILYVSNLIGDSLTRITPENEQFIDYFYYPSTNKILVKTIVDSDNNKNFESNDETNFLEMNLSNPEPGKEIFSRDLKDSLKHQIIGTK
jgi:hypothetical protein